VDVRIVGENLPGRRCPGYDNIHVGVQRQSEVVDLFPGDSERVVWDLHIDLVPGHRDFRGPYVQGRRGERFLYLSWGTVGENGSFEMFRRAKLMLAALDAPVIDAASRPGHRLEGTLGLTDGRGLPRCAAIRPPGISWTATPAG
jgi:hypothetical protein